MQSKKKCDDILRKNANIRGKRWKSGEEGENFYVLGEKYHFGKKGRGQKYHILGKYTPLV